MSRIHSIEAFRSFLFVLYAIQTQQPRVTDWTQLVPFVIKLQALLSARPTSSAGHNSYRGCIDCNSGCL